VPQCGIPLLKCKKQRILVKGKAATLYAEDGKCFLDGISSWWANLHGHAHPYIVKKIKDQMEHLEHVSFGDFTHVPAVELAEKLLPLLPGRMSKVFYSDNGSTAVETALKMVFQFWHNQQIKKIKVICFKGGYHGDTFGAMSAAGKNAFNRPFWPYLFEVQPIDPPLKGKEEQSLVQMKTILKEDNVACFIFEPLVLGAGGMIFYSKEGLDALLKMCREYHVLVIADEVMTGFGRTGPFFACEMLQEKPDIMCLSKGLTGGFLPLAITACTEEIYRAFLSEKLSKAFLHGHTYCANPLACSSALASLDLLQQEECSAQRNSIATHHNTFSLTWKDHPSFTRCESLGTILMMEYHSEEGSSYFGSLRDRLYYHFLDAGIILRPLGNVLYVLPPYCMTTEELHTIYDQIILTLR